MGQKSTIEWTDVSWNCVRGCSRISEGCRNCYAERIAARFSDPGPFATFAERKYTLKTGGSKSNWEPHWTGKVELIESKLDEPLHWKKPRRIFVNSMSDLFHEALSDSNLLGIFTVMGNSHIATGNKTTHQFQILTKRADRMQKFCSRLRWKTGLAFAEIAGRTQILNNMPYLEGYDPWVSMKNGGPEPPKELQQGWMPPQIWLGVSVENQATADERIPLLIQTPAAVHFVSYEPALGAVDFEQFPMKTLDGGENPGIDWVIVGGESGPGARPFDLQWAREVIEQCKGAGVACFYKQGGLSNACVHDRKGGHLECFPDDLKVREFPDAV